MTNWEYAVISGSLKRLLKYSETFKKEDVLFLEKEVEKLLKLIKKNKELKND